MPGRTLGALLLGGLLAIAGGARAEEWAAIAPGESTMGVVEVRFGPASRTVAETIEGYNAAQWIYEGARAPAGMKRMLVEFGLLTPAGYRREVVRALRLEPKPGIFTRALVLAGWGRPSGFTPEGHVPPSFFYTSGLVVSFDKAGEDAELLIFTPPQLAAPGPGERRP